MTLPNLIIAGVSKAGTTALRQYLVDHPEIGGSDVKEVFFWNRQDAMKHPDLEAYASHFEQAHGRKYVIDNTPRYFYDLRNDPAKLKDYLGNDLRVIVVLRDPVNRAFSFFRFKKRRLELPQSMDFTAYIDRCFSLNEEQQRDFGMIYNALEESKYDDSLEAWSSAYGDFVQIVFFEDMITRPKATIESICRWLSLDPSFYDTYMFQRENQAQNFRWGWLQRYAIKSFKRFEPFLLKNKWVRKSLTRLYYRINGRPFGDNVEPQDQQRLDEFFNPSVKRVRTILESRGLETFPTWLSKR